MRPICPKNKSCSAHFRRACVSLDMPRAAMSLTIVDENYDRFGARAQELIDRKVDVILASVPQAAAVAGRLTKTIPIVFATSGDPVKLGLVQNLSQPGGNITGLSLFYPELTVKHLELLRTV